MMNNMFSIFDPSTSFNVPLNWLSMTMIFMLLPYTFWLPPSRYTLMWSLLLKLLFKEFKTLISHSLSNMITFISLFIFILTNNFMGLFPYVFTASSHMSLSLTLSLTLWLSMMAYSMLNFINDLCSHLTPQGTPTILMPFMVLIESISLLIRPFTLAIRLTANMIAGHLLLSLLGASAPASSNLILYMPLILSSQILLFTLEMSVSIIQAYVFAVLSTLYSSEC